MFGFYLDFFFTTLFTCPGVASAGHSSKGSLKVQPLAKRLQPYAVRPFTRFPWPQTGHLISAMLLMRGARGFCGFLGPSVSALGVALWASMRMLLLSLITLMTIWRIISLISRTKLAGEYDPLSIRRNLFSHKPVSLADLSNSSFMVATRSIPACVDRGFCVLGVYSRA